MSSSELQPHLCCGFRPASENLRSRSFIRLHRHTAATTLRSRRCRDRAINRATSVPRPCQAMTTPTGSMSIGPPRP